jgi:hypothetical protein
VEGGDSGGCDCGGDSGEVVVVVVESRFQLQVSTGKAMATQTRFSHVRASCTNSSCYTQNRTDSKVHYFVVIGVVITDRNGDAGKRDGGRRDG